jgi:hypothetical protein
VVFSKVRRVGRAVVLVLLAWTAVDVLNPALCGLDELPFVAATVAVDSDSSTPTEGPKPAEDCFCCSHNVNFSAIVQIAISLSPDSGASADPVENPLWTSFPLYHPPRLLG